MIYDSQCGYGDSFACLDTWHRAYEERSFGTRLRNDEIASMQNEVDELNKLLVAAQSDSDDIEQCMRYVPKSNSKKQNPNSVGFYSHTIANI